MVDVPQAVRAAGMVAVGRAARRRRRSPRRRAGRGRVARELAGRGAAHPAQPPGDPRAGLVEVRHRRRLKQCARTLVEVAQAPSGPRDPSGQRARRHGRSLTTTPTRVRRRSPRAPWPVAGEWRHFAFALGGRGRAVRRRVAPLRVRDQTPRSDRNSGGRASPARRRRASDPRPQRPGLGALPVRSVQRQRGLDGDRLPRGTTCCAGRSSGCPARPSARTTRRRLLSMPGRLTRNAARKRLRALFAPVDPG